VRYALTLVVTTVLALAAPRGVRAQAAAVFESQPWSPRQPGTSLLVIPDSVRRKVGYQHWKGGAIGGSVGALAGLLLTAVASNKCYDCGSTDSAVLEATLIGAGLGGAFGFLVGAASPKYRWEAGSGDTAPAPGN
jgi:hypothetical protein